MLDIIIPRYNEPWDVGKKLFDMIGLQRGIDFGRFRVLLVHDGTEPFPQETFDGYPYTVEQIPIRHGGVSAARNAGIDNATAEWIMFCDFDDTFANLYALRDVLSVLPAENYDVLWSRMIAEDMIDGHNLLFFTPQVQTWVFTHAKVYRRSFLIESGIRFNEELAFQEDSEFNAQIIARLPHRRIGEIKTQSPMYIWIRRQNSVTKSGRDDEATYGHFRRNLMITQANLEHRGRANYCGMVTRTVWDAWFMTQGRRISNGMKRQIMKEFLPWITERKEAFLQVDAETLDKIRAVSRTELTDPGDNINDTPELVSAWVNMITERGVPHGINNDKPGADQTGRHGQDPDRADQRQHGHHRREDGRGGFDPCPDADQQPAGRAGDRQQQQHARGHRGGAVRVRQEPRHAGGGPLHGEQRDRGERHAELQQPDGG